MIRYVRIDQPVPLVIRVVLNLGHVDRLVHKQIREELGMAFKILDLHEFRFDEAPGVPMRFLGWSCLVEKR